MKEQVIKYAEQTMDDIVEAYINPELPSEEWELDKLVSKVKEFVYLLADLTPEQLFDLSMDDIKTFMHEQVRNAYDIKEAQVNQIRGGLMRDAERFFILQQIDTLWREHLQQMDALRESVGLRGYGQKDPLIEYKSEGYELFLDMMTDIRRKMWVYSMFQFQPATCCGDCGGGDGVVGVKVKLSVLSGGMLRFTSTFFMLGCSFISVIS